MEISHFYCKSTARVYASIITLTLRFLDYYYWKVRMTCNGNSGDGTSIFRIPFGEHLK